MKSLLKIALIFIIPPVLFLSGCNTDDISVTSLTLDKTSESVVVGGVTFLTATVEPVEATNTEISWSSSDGTVAAVAESGIVIGIAEGTATTDDGGFATSCEVAVGTVNISRMIIAPDELRLNLGGTGQLEVFINPWNATNQEVSWESSDRDVLTVDSNGSITAINYGDAIVTASASSGNYSAQSNITVGWMPATGEVDSHHKISDIEGGFIGVLDVSDFFGVSVTSPGDIDGDGVADLVGGAICDDDGGSARGAVWVLFMEEE